VDHWKLTLVTKDSTTHMEYILVNAILGNGGYPGEAAA
jgi:hypothetical protein